MLKPSITSRKPSVFMVIFLIFLSAIASGLESFNFDGEVLKLNTYKTSTVNSSIEDGYDSLGFDSLTYQSLPENVSIVNHFVRGDVITIAGSAENIITFSNGSVVNTNYTFLLRACCLL